MLGKTLTEGALTATVKSLLDSPDRRAAMETRIRDFACPDANERIYSALMGLIRP